MVRKLIATMTTRIAVRFVQLPAEASHSDRLARFLQYSGVERSRMMSKLVGAIVAFSEA